MSSNKMFSAMRIALVALLLGSRLAASESLSSERDAASVTTVNAMNYVRAKTALQFDKYYARAGGINRCGHTRTLASTSVAQDRETVHGLQDQMRISSASSRPYAHQEYDSESFDTTTHYLVELGRGLTDNSKSADPGEEVDPIKQLITAAFGFGTLPENEPFLIIGQPGLPSEGPYRLDVTDEEY
ncbi:MAG: hypothetical protein ACJAUG_001794 [Halioglobus sp.]|jgi:hypothetical protein